jgi:hypothetical protein
MPRWAPSVAALAAVAAVLAGCGGGGSKTSADGPSSCVARFEATARADTIIDLYRRGELGTRAHLEKWAGEKIPFLDDRGQIIPYGQMSPRRSLRTDNFALKVTGLNSKVLLAVRDAVARAKRKAATRCA